jgi:hypothetical protein
METFITSAFLLHEKETTRGVILLSKEEVSLGNETIS